MELKRHFRLFFLSPKQNIRSQGPITINKILNNAIKMKASYSGGLLRYGT